MSDSCDGVFADDFEKNVRGRSYRCVRAQIDKHAPFLWHPELLRVVQIVALQSV